MNDLEKACLNHAKDELRYRRSTQAKRDMEADAARRVKADKAVGHLPTCGLLRCDPACKRA